MVGRAPNPVNRDTRSHENEEPTESSHAGADEPSAASEEAVVDRPVGLPSNESLALRRGGESHPAPPTPEQPTAREDRVPTVPLTDSEAPVQGSAPLDAEEATETANDPALQRSDLAELATHPDESLAGVARTLLQDHDDRIRAAFDGTFDVDFSEVPDHPRGGSDAGEEDSVRAVEAASGGDGAVPPSDATTVSEPDEEGNEDGGGHDPSTWDDDLAKGASADAASDHVPTPSSGFSMDAPDESPGAFDWDEELDSYGPPECGGFRAERRPLDADVGAFIPIGGDLADDDIARRVADRIAERAGWDASATRVLVEILEESAHHARQDAILRQIKQGVAPEALLAAFRTYAAWNEEYAHDPYAHLSWDTATSLAESYAGYPGVDELMVHLERLHNAYCATRRAPGFIRYRRYFSTYVREMLDDGIDDGWAVGDECVLRTAGYGIRA